MNYKIVTKYIKDVSFAEEVLEPKKEFTVGKKKTG